MTLKIQLRRRRVWRRLGGRRSERVGQDESDCFGTKRVFGFHYAFKLVRGQATPTCL